MAKRRRKKKAVRGLVAGAICLEAQKTLQVALTSARRDHRTINIRRILHLLQQCAVAIAAGVSVKDEREYKRSKGDEEGKCKDERGKPCPDHECDGDHFENEDGECVKIPGA